MYVGTITYLPLIGTKFLYLATIIDPRLTPPGRLGDRGPRKHRRRHRGPVRRRTAPVAASPERSRTPTTGPVHQPGIAETCRQGGVRQSLSAIGSSTDNALAVSFTRALRHETLEGRKHWSSEREARLDAFRRLNRYNTRRRHLGQRSPIAYETALNTTSTGPSCTALVQDSGSRTKFQCHRPAGLCWGRWPAPTQLIVYRMWPGRPRNRRRFR
ncbi:integrase core domain-containing protein, partial [Streptomyces sp. NPDC093594]|uniref:integrase core domain-containing protein n=1 Tax=Streptomyces sp. NPDC093594 TaxID=3155305 RepID=UPI00344B645C